MAVVAPAQASHTRGGHGLHIPELEACIHCGLCLNQCPTYRVTHLEAESPRGRIYLVNAAAQERLDLAAAADHLYLCLMCRACETACPSGVQYGRIAEAAREALGPPGPPVTRLLVRLALRHLMPHPWRLRVMATLMRLSQRSGLAMLAARIFPGRLGRRLGLMPAVREPFYVPEAEVLPAIGERRARVAFLSGCAMRMFFGSINEATVRVLRRNGCEVVIPAGQACCGALNVHNGEAGSARAMARRNIDAFPDDVDAIIVNAAGCGAAMKEYGYLLARDPAYGSRAQQFAARVQDVSEFLASLGVCTPSRPFSGTVTYQDPCHLAHGQRVRDEPRALLAATGARLVEMSGADRCCGSAGIYNVLQPEMAETLLREKMDAIRQTGAGVVVAPNPGCMIQLRYGARRFGVPVRVMHLMDLVDEAGV